MKSLMPSLFNLLASGFWLLTLVPCPLSSSKKFPDICVPRETHLFVCSTEYYITIFKHNKSRIDQTKVIPFLLEDEVTFVVAYHILARKNLNILETVCHEDRRDV